MDSISGFLIIISLGKGIQVSIVWIPHKSHGYFINSKCVFLQAKRHLLLSEKEQKKESKRIQYCSWCGAKDR